MKNSPIHWSTLAIPAILAVLAGCASAPPSIDQMGPQAEETLLPGDIVQLNVWREEDLTGEFMVDREGSVVLPRVGKWDVRGETEADLEARLTEELGRVLRNPSIDVIVLRRIQVVGAVKEPGVYPLDNTVTLGAALAEAGGVSESGQRNRLELVRDGQRFTVRMNDDRRLSTFPLRSGDMLVVPERNWFLRNYGVVVTALTSAAGVAAVIITSR